MLHCIVLLCWIGLNGISLVGLVYCLLHARSAGCLRFVLGLLDLD